MSIKLLTNLVFSAVILGSCADKKANPEISDARGVISCTGYSFVQNDDEYEITAPFSGKVISVFADTLNDVTIGERLVVIENSEILTIQQEYLEAKNLLEYYAEEYTRQGDLTVENATSMKKMQTAKRDFQSADLKFRSLRNQILQMGLNPDSLKAEKLRSALSVRSSAKGIITGKYIRKGTFVSKGQKLFDVASGQMVLVKLYIPEKSYLLLSKDQRIEFSPVADSLNLMQATLISISSSIDPATHMATVIAKPDNENIRIIPGMSVKANIYTSFAKE